MSNQTTIQIRIESKIKNRASSALKEMGLDLSSGIKLFLNEVATTETIPFLPSTQAGKKLRHEKRYAREIKAAEKYGKRFTNGKDLLEDIFR